MLKSFVLKSPLMEIHFINYGARITKWLITRKNSKGELCTVDIITGYDHDEDFIKGDKYFGAICGRCCNRIEKGSFQLNGKQYQLATNNGPNHLHGGIEGFSSKYFEVVKYQEGQIDKYILPMLIMKYVSVDGEEGYPGTLTLEVKYAIQFDNELFIEYIATSDKDTICNITSHGFYNLQG